MMRMYRPAHLQEGSEKKKRVSSERRDEEPDGTHGAIFSSIVGGAISLISARVVCEGKRRGNGPSAQNEGTEIEEGRTGGRTK